MSKEGYLFVHDNGGNGSIGTLWCSVDPRAATPIFTVMSDTSYANACGSIKSLSIGIEKYVYTADSGRGATVDTPVY